MQTKKTLITIIFLVSAFLVIKSILTSNVKSDTTPSPKQNSFVNDNTAAKDVSTEYHEITGNIKKGETLFEIFKKYKLDLVELFKLKEASADIHRLKNLYPGRPYKIVIDDRSHINEFTYWIDDESILNITRTDSGFCASKKNIEYDKKLLHIGGIIKDNLIESLGEGKENLMLALQLSDILAWDIDFQDCG